MKALSVKQPWASMIARGEKTIETRTWRTEHRGPLVICASRYPANCGPRGVALALADLVDCRDMEPTDEAEAQCPFHWRLKSWLLRHIRIIEPPVPVSGKRGIFELDRETAYEIVRRIRPPGGRLRDGL